MRTSSSDPCRFRRTGFMEYWHGVRGSVRLRTREFHHLCPLLGFVRDELAEFGGQHRHRLAAQIGEPRLDRGSARPALIASLSLSTISADVFLGTPTP